VKDYVVAEVILFCEEEKGFAAYKNIFV